MNSRLPVLLCAVLASGLMASEPPVLEEKALPEIKGAITLPKDWYVKVDKEDDVVVYQFSREKPTEAGFTTGLILTVTPKVKERTEMSPSQYGIEMLSATLDEGAPGIEPVKDGPIQSFRASHQVEGENGAIEMINIARANDGTGTLYFLTWQSPVSESDSLKELRERILSSLRLDPGF
jgi:hypothetical protein